MPSSSPTVRFAFAVATLLSIAALSLHLSNWLRQGTVNWPAATNMLGLLVLTATGTVDPPPGRLRTVLTIVALVLIFPSAVFLVLR